MTADVIRVKPRPGLILAGVPSAGIDLPRALAEEWIGNRLVIKVEPSAPEPVTRKVTRRSPKGSGASRPTKRRRTR